VTDRLPLGFPLLAAGTVLVTPAAAAALVELLEPGRRQCRRDGITVFHEPLQSALLALDAAAKMHRGERLSSTAPAVVWITTLEAAGLVGVSRQAVTKAVQSGRIRSDRRGRRVVVSEAAVRLWAESRAA
jgi:excisionase family DNA binding protein